jgi:hypothetical protein
MVKTITMILKSVFLLIALILAFILGSCGKDNVLGVFTDLSGPRLIATSPTNGQANVSTGSSIILTFSETVSPSSVTPVVVAISPALSCSYRINGNKVVLQPASVLPSGQRFNVTVHSAVKDLNGNSMSADQVFSFRIAGTNHSMAQVTFLVDATSAKSSYPFIYLTGSWDALGDRDNTWNNGKRYAMFDDGLHGDGAGGDGLWAVTVPLTVDVGQAYSWAADDDSDPGNGYIKSQDFFVIASAPMVRTIILHSPMPVTFNFYDTAGKVSTGIYLRGDFNSFGLDNRMSGPSGPNNLYSVTLLLKEKSYSYKYFAENSWDLLNTGANRQVNIVYGGTSVINDYDLSGNSVTFNYYDIEGKISTSVYLKGDFNGWSDSGRMSGPTGPNRKFTAVVNVSSGQTYSYKYFADNSYDKLNLNNRNINLAQGVRIVDDYYQGPRPVTFVYYDYEGKIISDIYVRGDFNGWSLDYSGQLSQDSVTNYKYAITLPLSPGSYNYKYFVDGDYSKVNVINRNVTVSSTNTPVVHDIYAGY